MYHFVLALCLAVLTLLGSAQGGMAQDGATSPVVQFSVAPADLDADASDQPAYVLLDDGTPDYDAWARLAERVERALEVGRASDAVMADLRANLTDWRALFAEAKQENDIRIDTLKTQIATLGPKPKEGESEPAILTERRDELTTQLNAARLPVQRAEEAHSQADVLINGIDKLMRGRQADQLLKLGPTPFNPTIWPAALTDLVETFRLAGEEMARNWGRDAQWQDFKRDLPLSLTLSLIGAVLLLRGRYWVMRFGAFLRRNRRGPALGVVGFLVSLGQFLIPLLGISFLVFALYLTGILGLRSQVIVDVLPNMVMVIFASLWISNRVFGVEGAGWTILDMPSEGARTEARWTTNMLGVLLAIWDLLTQLALHENYPQTTWAVISFPVFALMGLFLLRLARLLRLHLQLRESDEQVGTFRTSVLHMLSILTNAVAIAGPLAAAVGYVTLAASFMIPWVLTLGLVAVLEVLHWFVVSLYGVVLRKDDEEAGQALWPILISFFISLLAVPLLALIWGARITDLTELWTTVMSGFEVGGARITPRTFVTFAIVFVLGYAATRFLQSMLKSSILPKTKLDIGGQNAISAGVGYVGIFLAALLAITSAGLDLSSVAIVAGALSVGIGFGLQNIVSNFVSGIILLIERPISEGDWIEVGGQMGYVRDISVRSTRIETFDRSDVILPNSDLISGVVTNYTRGNSIGRIILPVGVGYGTDTKRVEEVLREIAEDHPMVTVNPAPSVIFTNFGADALEFEIRAVLSDVNYSLTVKSEMNHEIARRFAEEGFEIPFAQRDLWIRNPEALRPAAAVAGGAAGAGQTVPPEAMTLDDLQNGADEGVEGEGDE
ncbi:DUF3772 domain-containing protein [Aliiroseovarius crassostreae]|uniref:DUF3772 domain-containing protein n=1 Tax=Aliiroseovarius crassostreae TaxID=154981 RepID=UPI003C797F6F